MDTSSKISDIELLNLISTDEPKNLVNARLLYDCSGPKQLTFKLVSSDRHEDIISLNIDCKCVDCSGPVLIDPIFLSI